MENNSLNPCYGGICSLRMNMSYNESIDGCLNPCYGGICSLR